ncbi:hypothetical protein FEM48_Zijuj01G0101600 [Ziziphus jujuba var. spinosa]|uniref:Protein POLLENLESS 3 n=1 Tax=Ziziphus jujuba var. spinosa TaxID=714518 RepID=A0A978W0M7_ZIZJJ|nr:hypothetical protein FEM48_Zijuj01G0101600 [Ziziphus jujuba var. spinosa]
MWKNNKENFQSMGFSTPPPPSSKLRSCRSPVRVMSERKRTSPSNNCGVFHIIHKVPAGDSPYVRAKQVQLIEKDPSRAVSLFWSAINAGDRVDSALKDMAVVMKQLNRSDEAIEAIKSFRHLCPYDSQESIDNVLVELYKRAGRIEEEIEMLQSKLKRIDETIAFGGRKIKIARSQGKKVHITIEQEKSRILGNLAWAYLQQNNYRSAEEHYRKALLLEPDPNKQCNLAICLMYMNRLTEAKSLLQAVRASSGNTPMDESYAKSFERAHQMLTELDQQSLQKPIRNDEDSCKETSMSLTFPINRNLKGDNSFINGGQHHVSGITAPRRWENGHGEETLQLAEQQHREYYCANHLENKECGYGHENKNLRCQSSNLRSTSKHSQESMSVCKRKQDYSENSDESRSVFPGVKQNWVDTVGTESSPLYRKTYCSPAPSSRTLESLFTQPRRCSWGFTDGDKRAGTWENGVAGKWNETFSCRQPRRCSWGFTDGDKKAGTWENDVVGNSNENFSYRQPMKTENLLEHAARNSNEAQMSEVALRNLGSSLPAPFSGDRRSRPWGDSAHVKGYAAAQSVSKPIVSWRNSGYLQINGAGASENVLNGTWRMNGTWENSNLKSSASKDSNLSRKLAEERPLLVDNATASVTSTQGGQNWRFDTTVSGSKTSTEGCSGEKSPCETDNLDHHDTENSHPNEDSSLCYKKKSWADMVEEEEQLLLSGGAAEYLDGWSSEEEFNDENLNSNIIQGSPRLLTQMKSLSQKLEFFDLKDGYSTPENTISSRKPTVRRSLCFDQNQKPVDNFSPSPLPKKALNFEDSNSLQVNGKGAVSGKNLKKLRRRNRLQVFQDITLHQASP